MSDSLPSWTQTEYPLPGSEKQRGRRYACLVETLGKALLGLALVLALVGGGLFLAAKFGISRLPGDVVIRRGNFTFYAPIGLMILLSIVLTIALNLFLRR